MVCPKISYAFRQIDDASNLNYEKNASDMQAEKTNFSQLVNHITDRFFTSILTINSLILEEK